MLLHFVLFVFTYPLTLVVGTFQGATTINPNCQTKCGNVTVPYPFGIGTNCSLDDDSFNLTCDTSTELPKLFIGNGNIDIYNISDSKLRIFTIVSSQCYNQSGFVDGNTSSINLQKHPAFTFSTKNKFTVIGCDDYALITGADGDGFSSGCFGLCQKAPVPTGRQCSGIGCCQISIPKGLSYYNVTLESLHDHSDVWTFNECSHGFLVEEGVFEFRGADDLTGDYQTFEDRVQSTLPIVLDWVIKPDGSCREGNVCKGNSSCYDVSGGGYRCKCNEGYEGNPYIDTGCQDIDKSNDQGANPCDGVCTNTIGSYNCTCVSGFFGNASITDGCQPVATEDSKFQLTIFMIGCAVDTRIVDATRLGSYRTYRPPFPIPEAERHIKDEDLTH